MVNLDYLYNPDAAKEVLGNNHFSDKKLGFQVIEHGTILPRKDTDKDGKFSWVGFGGIVDSNGRYIKESYIHLGTGGAYTPPPESIQHSSETVVYLGISYIIWGHCITDNIRRLWFLKSDYFKHEFKNCRLVYIPFGTNTIENQPNFRRLLEVLEIDVDKLQPITQPTRFDKIILPDESFFVDKIRKFTNEYREVIDCVRNFALKNRTPTSSKKIYYFHGARQIGEERLAEYFKSKGYEIVSPEKLTFDEQLNLLINAESFASTFGSCSHNSIFLRDDTETILIPRNANFYTLYQEALNQVHPLKVNYIDSSLSVFRQTYGNHCYIISEQLKRFFGDKWDGYEEDDFKTFLQYVNDSNSKRFAVHLNSIKYYDSVFEDFLAQLKRYEDFATTYYLSSDLTKWRGLLKYQTHVAFRGWASWQDAEQASNPLDQKLDIQAVKIKFPNHKVYYAVYYNDKEGWSEEVSNGGQAGTTGKSKAIYGIRIRLDEAGQKEFDILYRVHKFDGDWTPWAKNGETLYSYGQKLNALQIKLEPKT